MAERLVSVIVAIPWKVDLKCASSHLGEPIRSIFKVRCLCGMLSVRQPRSDERLIKVFNACRNIPYPRETIRKCNAFDTILECGIKFIGISMR